MDVVIYARVSTKTQDYDRQLSELRSYAAKMLYKVVREFAEVISGAKKVNEREAVDFLQIIEYLNDRKISVYIHQNGLETLLPDGKINPIASLVLGILAQFNSMERTLIRNRMESGYNSFRSKGGQVGRKEGYRKPTETMMTQYSKELALLKKGISLRNVSAITGTSVGTLQKVKRLFM